MYYTQPVVYNTQLTVYYTQPVEYNTQLTVYYTQPVEYNNGKGLEGYYPIATLDFLCVSGLWHLMSVLLGGVVFKARLCVQSACFVGLVWLMVGCSML